MDASVTDLTDSGKEHKKPRFQLCFSPDNLITHKSDIRKATVKLWGFSSPIITPKFYSSNDGRFNYDKEEIETLMKKLATIDDLGPKEKYKEPVLESHRYGWFDEKFNERNPEVDRIHFPRRTSDMVRIQNLFSEFTAKIGDRCE